MDQTKYKMKLFSLCFCPNLVIGKLFTDFPGGISYIKRFFSIIWDFSSKQNFEQIK